METFVYTEKYVGTCYNPANWIYLWKTAACGKIDRYNKRALSKKQIYMYPLEKNFRKYLCGNKEKTDKQEKNL